MNSILLLMYIIHQLIHLVKLQKNKKRYHYNHHYNQLLIIIQVVVVVVVLVVVVVVVEKEEAFTFLGAVLTLLNYPVLEPLGDLLPS